MHLIIAAAVSVVTALLEFTVVPDVKIGDAAPHPVLVLGVIWVIVGGWEPGLAWAFVGGLALDIVGGRPLGSSAFSLLIAIGIASVIGGLLNRIRIAAPILATVIASPLYSMLLLAATTALSNAQLTSDSLRAVLPSTAYDLVLVAIVGPLTVAIVQRRRETERVDW